MTSRTKEILNKIVLVNVDMTIWSGYKRTSEADLSKMGTKIPPGGVITKGGKQIFPRDPLKDFHSLKKEISRKLTSLGVAVLGGSARAIPVEKMKEVEKYLEAAERKHSGLINAFETNYDNALAQHLTSIPDPVVNEVVRASIISKSDAVGRMGFGWDIFKVNPQRGKGDGLVSNLSNKLFSEVAQAANEIYTKSFMGKERVGTRALNQIVALRDKMAGLMVLDGESIKPVVDHMDKVLSQMPQNGWVENVNYSALLGLLSMISDTEKMVAHANQINANTAAAIAVGNLPAPAPASEATLGQAEEVTASVEQTKTEHPTVHAPKFVDLWDVPAAVEPSTVEQAPTQTQIIETPIEPEIEVPAEQEVVAAEAEEETKEEILPLLPNSRLSRVANATFF